MAELTRPPASSDDAPGRSPLTTAMTWLVAAWIVAVVVAFALLPEWTGWAVSVGVTVAGALVAQALPQPVRRRLGRAVEAAFQRLSMFAGYVMVPSAVFLAVRWVSDLGHPAPRFIGLAAFAILLLWLAGSISTERLRGRLSSSLEERGLKLVYAAVVAVLAAAVFSSVTLEMTRVGWIELDPVPEDASRIADFYFWHLIDAIPGQPLSTLRIDAPFEYEDRAVGALVLAFNLMIIIPVIAWIRAALKKQHAETAVPAATDRPTG
jgi:hypothetical protein